MRFDVLTLFPETIKKACDFSIIKRATEQGLISVNAVNPRDYSKDKHKKVDDTPYGGGAGMVLMPQPYIDAYDSVEKLENSITVMLSPQGEPLSIITFKKSRKQFFALSVEIRSRYFGNVPNNDIYVALHN